MAVVFGGGDLTTQHFEHLDKHLRLNRFLRVNRLPLFAVILHGLFPSLRRRVFHYGELVFGQPLYHLVGLGLVFDIERSPVIASIGEVEVSIVCILRSLASQLFQRLFGRCGFLRIVNVKCGLLADIHGAKADANLRLGWRL